MTIEKKENGSEITLLPAGRLDTTTAPQLEEQINAVSEGAERLILDFQDLDYLSSAVSGHPVSKNQFAIVTSSAVGLCLASTIITP